jgi:hypothetical protein
MIAFMKSLWRDRRGNALVIAAAALPLVLGSAGLASDTIQWTLWKRQLQRAADSAALAGVYAKIQPQTVSDAVATDLAKNNHTGISLFSGYPQIAFPADTSTRKDAVRVSLALQKSLSFSSLFMGSAPIITAEATAATIETGVYCVVSLESTGATGITATGNGNIDLGCGMITNSMSMTAAIATGSSTVNASPIAAVGNVGDSENWGGAELLPFTVREDDPFAEVDPTTAGCPGSQLRVNSNQTESHTPGCYSSMNLDGTVTLADGVYIIDGGNLTIGAQAHVSCGECTFVLTNSDTGSTATIGSVDINGGAELHLGASQSGPYDGMLIYQDRRAPSGPSQVNKINGNSASLLSGALYFPSQQLQINGTAGLNFNCAQFVARTVEFSGDGGIINTCIGGYGSKSIKGRHVRLVA